MIVLNYLNAFNNDNIEIIEEREINGEGEFKVSLL
jgi:hypothetical protein